ncbi:MAG: hypothetical protein WAO74_05990 [Polaribacter sp.]|uniref:hypothetical protein n=1 Tax=Polaribacter sp. TaxID=1920175 RepID=UPI003BB0766D
MLFLCIGFSIQSQITSTDFRKILIEVKKDTIQLDSVAINPQKFKILDNLNNTIPSIAYQIDFSKAILIIDARKYQKITVEYFRIPDFVTKIYTPFDEKYIIQSNTNQAQLYSLTTNKEAKDIQLFEGLQTRGFITRGITSGNNQNVVTNSSLDLEISGKLSKDLTLRANIFDTNIPIQENGYSQNLTDFDRISLELFTEKWNVKAGDISLENKENFFVPFTKQVSGLNINASLNDELEVTASGAIVRGKFNNFKFVGVEGNQGPYKLFGNNNEAVILIIEDSDRVYVNGIPIERGENKDYIINYNLGEIIFNTTYPITNDMRITVEFQYAERNYTRFITYEKAAYEGEKFSISGFFYSENDAKNQPLQQSLSNNQKEILANAGNNAAAMVSESAFLDSFNENKILYKKVINGNVEFFEYSTNETDELYNVTYTNVGQNNGDYVLDDTIAIGNIFLYVGTNQGDYSPIVRLVAPTKSQFLVVKSNYSPTEKTTFSSEMALSNNDANLFSSIDDNQNQALAAKIGWQQLLIDKKWKLKSSINHEYAHKNFKTLQRWESIEFNRDWNLLTNNGTKNYFQSELLLEKNKENYALYRFNNLTYTSIFSGIKHEITSKLKSKNTTFFVDGSFLKNSSTLEENSFLRAIAKVEHSFSKSWVGAFTNLENNTRKNNTTQEFIATSHRYKEFETYLGIGDTAKVFVKFGVNYRTNDSIKENRFQEINNRKTFYIKSKLIKNKNTNLSVYANYRLTDNNFSENEKTLNSKIVYNQKIAKNFITLGSTYETSSGNVARQDYVYVKVEPGLGFYTWIDYNNDGVKDFNEFEIALFQDQAEYLRLPKPNLRFIATQKAKWKQSITLNFIDWKTKNGLKKILSHFYNQSFLTVENEQERNGNSFNLNPFDLAENKLIALNYNFRNSLYFNKNIQKYSTSYTFASARIKQQYFIGTQENESALHQIDFAHKIGNFWLLEILLKNSENNLDTENFNDRNYQVLTNEIQPKISFLYNDNHRFSGFYHFKNKRNLLFNLEELDQHKLGLDYFYISQKKNQISANLTFFQNNFTGNANTPVAYQMLEGLQAGKNYTWNVVFNQKLNSFLNLNLSYFGRKSENSQSIHSGNVQLRANF